MNGHADCSDPACAELGFTCIDIPSGWSGVGALYEGSPVDVPACGFPYAVTEMVAHSGIQFESAVCSPCVCSPLVTSCEFDYDWVAYGDSSCSSSAPNSWSYLVGGSACGSADIVGGKSFKAASSAPTIVANCVPSGGQASHPAPTWTGAAVVCGGAQVGAGCSGTAVCVPPAPARFTSANCIWREGDQACPTTFVEKNVLYDAGTSVTDTRGCAACACTAPSTLSCSMTIDFYADTGCTNLVASVANDNNCVPSSGDAHSAKITSFSPPSGTCGAGGGTPSGTVVTHASWTVCCIP